MAQRLSTAVLESPAKSENDTQPGKEWRQSVPDRDKCVDIVGIQFEEDSDDTDLEDFGICRTNVEYRTDAEIYQETCHKLNIHPIRMIINVFKQEHACLQNLGLKHSDILAFAHTVEVSEVQIRSLLLDGNSLGKKGLKYAMWLVEDCAYITTVSLSNLSISENGACKLICNYLGRNSTVTTFDLSENGLNVNDARHLANLIQTNKTVKTLNLSHNLIDDESCKFLTKALAKNEMLKHLDLSWNLIRMNGGIELAKRVISKATSKLEGLQLSMNGLADKGVIAICQALKTNRNLRVLDLSNNRITDCSVENIAKMLAASKTLTSFMISDNPIRLNSVHNILERIHNSESAAIRYLDISSMHVERTTINLVKTIKKKHGGFEIKHKGILGEKIDVF